MIDLASIICYADRWKPLPVNKWDSDKYLKFEKERTQPAIDLVRRVERKKVSSALDVGCGCVYGRDKPQI